MTAPEQPTEHRQTVLELAFCALQDLPADHIVATVRAAPVRVRHMRRDLEAGTVRPERVLRLLLERDMLRPGFGGTQ